MKFVRWGLAQAPSRRLMLVLHGALGNLGYGAPTRKDRDGQWQGLLALAGLESPGEDPNRRRDRDKLERDWRKIRENGATYMGIREAGRGLTAIRDR